jgi:hypothetical protein
MYLKYSLAALFVLSLAGLTRLVEARAGDDPKLDKKVVDIVMKAGDAIKNAKAFHAEGTIQADSAQEKKTITVSCDVERPNRLALHAQQQNDKTGGVDLVSNGKMVISNIRQDKQYSEKDAPDDLEGFATSLRTLGLPVGLLLQNILPANPGEALMTGVTECSYAGTEKINGTDAHHLKFTQPDFDWELWVSSEGTPYILQMKSSLGSDQKTVVTETYKNWKINEPIAADVFSFTPPKDFKKVD